MAHVRVITSVFNMNERYQRTVHYIGIKLIQEEFRDLVTMTRATTFARLRAECTRIRERNCLEDYLEAEEEHE